MKTFRETLKEGRSHSYTLEIDGPKGSFKTIYKSGETNTEAVKKAFPNATKIVPYGQEWDDYAEFGVDDPTGHYSVRASTN